MCAPPSCELSFAFGNFILVYLLSLRLCTCALVRLLIDSLEFCDRSIFYFICLVEASGRLDIRSFWDTFIYVSKHFLSLLSFAGFVPSRTFYASVILSEPLVL
jgi:hypothetical protein